MCSYLAFIIEDAHGYNGVWLQSTIVQSATRVDDGMPVVLKYYRMDRLPMEHTILLQASYYTHSRDPSNHCMKVFQFLTDPKDPRNIVAVMPYLRKWNDPPPRTIGEALALLAQLLEVCFITPSNLGSEKLSDAQAIKWLHNQNIVWHDEEYVTCVFTEDITQLLVLQMRHRQ